MKISNLQPAAPTPAFHFTGSGFKLEQAVTIGPLSRSDAMDLARCEGVIQRGLDSFLEVGAALAAVREGKLYRHKYSTFAAYCEQRWQMTSRRARQLLDAAEVVASLAEGEKPVISNQAAVMFKEEKGTMVPFSSTADLVHALHSHTLPTSERQARPLVGLPVEQAKAAWEKAKASGDTTARGVQQAVDEARGRVERVPGTHGGSEKPPRTWPVPNVNGVYVGKVTESRVFNHSAVRAEIELLEIAEGKWISAVTTSFKIGSCAGRTRPLSARGETFPTRERALSGAATMVKRDCDSVIRNLNGTCTPRQRAAAKKLFTWAQRISADLAGVIARQAPPATENRKPKIADEKPSFQARVRRENRGSRIKEFAGAAIWNLEKLARDLTKKDPVTPDSCREAIRKLEALQAAYKR